VRGTQGRARDTGGTYAGHRDVRGTQGRARDTGTRAGHSLEGRGGAGRGSRVPIRMRVSHVCETEAGWRSCTLARRTSQRSIRAMKRPGGESVSGVSVPVGTRVRTAAYWRWPSHACIRARTHAQTDAHRVVPRMTCRRAESRGVRGVRVSLCVRAFVRVLVTPNWGSSACSLL
jgi:hypothetical protein